MIAPVAVPPPLGLRAIGVELGVRDIGEDELAARGGDEATATADVGEEDRPVAGGRREEEDRLPADAGGGAACAAKRVQVFLPMAQISSQFRVPISRP